MIDPRRLQRHVRESLRAQTTPLRIGAFTFYYHAELAYRELNVAIPDEPTEGRRVPILGREAAGLTSGPDEDPAYALMLLEAQFRARARQPHVEYVAECHVGLDEALLAAGYREDARVPLFASTRETWRSAPEVEGLRFEAILPKTPWETTRAYLQVQREAFGFDLDIPEAAPREHWSALGIGAGVLVLHEGAPVGAGGFTAPVEGLCEVRGLAVVPSARRRGVGTFLLSALARIAHEGGVEAVVATPDGPATARMAKAAGFAPVATLVSFTMGGAAAP